MIAIVYATAFLFAPQGGTPRADLQPNSHLSSPWHDPATDEGARRVCLVERATGRTICRRMDSWRRIARRLEREQAD